VGVVALAEALLETKQTSLTKLVLKDVGMGDEGITALASFESQGRMEELEDLNISKNEAVTGKGIIVLARAINARGLPGLNEFYMQKLSTVTVAGVSAITNALIKGCPRLTDINFPGSVSDDDTLRECIRGMLELAGRAGQVNVNFNTQQDDDEDNDEGDEDEDDFLG
jgi:hypothetical protein